MFVQLAELIQGEGKFVSLLSGRQPNVWSSFS